MRKPTKAQVAAARRQIAREDSRARQRLDTPERRAIEEETSRRAGLPPEHPEHICGRSCDGQDGIKQLLRSAAGETVRCRMTPTRGEALVRLWLDDVRVPSEEWTWVKTVAEAKALVMTGTVRWMSLDHDLGDGCALCWDMPHEAVTQIYRRTPECGTTDNAPCGLGCGCHETGYDFVKWLAETGNWPPTKPRVHSANPAGATNMRATIERYWRPPPSDRRTIP